MSSDTGKSAMTREEAKELIDAAINSIYKTLPKGGANVSFGVQDQRFTKLISWVWVTLGAAAVATGAWGVNSIQELNVKVGVLISQRDRDSEDVKDLRDRVRLLEARQK